MSNIEFSIKRASDLFWLVIAFVVFAPAIIVITFGIAIDDGLPLLFIQERLGKNREKFRVYKFRTMRDGQVTRFGAILRRCGLDELPQLWNILRGEMSFVGPRPLTQADVNRLKWNAKTFDFRWRLKPGLTGFAQIYAGQGLRASLIKERQYLWYTNIRLDFRILAITFLMNLFGKRRIKQHLLGIKQNGS